MSDIMDARGRDSDLVTLRSELRRLIDAAPGAPVSSGERMRALLDLSRRIQHLSLEVRAASLSARREAIRAQRSPGLLAGDRAKPTESE
ncbi:MAG: hypothetical protein AAGM38_12225 [Pseudomonadota bacterium]